MNTKNILLLTLITLILNACDLDLTKLKSDNIKKMTFGWQYNNKIELHELTNKDSIDYVIKLLKNAENIESCCRAQHELNQIDLDIDLKDSLKKSINIYFYIIVNYEIDFQYGYNFYRNDSIMYFLKDIGIEPSMFEY